MTLNQVANGFKKSKLAKAFRLSLPIALALNLIGCGEDNVDPSEINAASSYEFFDSGSSTVDYLASTTALILIEELDHLIGSQYLQDYGQTYGYQATLALLNRVYTLGTYTNEQDSLWNSNLYNTTESISTPINAISFTDESPTYQDLSPNVNLQNLVPGYQQPLHNRKEPVVIAVDPEEVEFSEDELLGDFIGWSVVGVENGDGVFDAMIQDWLGMIATLASDDDKSTRFTQNSINYRLLINTTLKASIPYFQISHNHLASSKINDYLDNNSATNMQILEENWDLAFGYSGLASNGKLIQTENYDSDWLTDNINLEDMRTRKLTGASLFAYQADEKSPLTDVTYYDDFFTFFVEGRSLASLEQVSLTADEVVSGIRTRGRNIVFTWEKALASKFITYINQTVNEANLVKVTTERHQDYIDAWSNMKALAISLQFNPSSLITSEDLVEFNKDIGTYPPGSTAIRNFQSSLILDRFEDPAIRNELQDIYSFSTENIESW